MLAGCPANDIPLRVSQTDPDIVRDLTGANRHLKLHRLADWQWLVKLKLKQEFSGFIAAEVQVIDRIVIPSISTH